MEIRNKINTLETLTLTELQGYECNDLKTVRTEQEIDKLCKSIRKHGFSMPIFISKKHNYILDGTGRWQAIHKLVAEGYEFKEIPVLDIEARDKSHCKELTLALS